MPPETKNTGCETMLRLWDIACQDLAVDSPGVSGAPQRGISFWENENIVKFMQLATMKCWEERSRTNPNTPFPPLALEKKVYESYPEKSTTKGEEVDRGARSSMRGYKP